MARKPKIAKKKYLITVTFHGYINDTYYDHKKGDVVEWTEAEFDFYKRYAKEIV